MKDKIIYNYLLDLRKEEVNCFERAHIIQDYLQANKLTVRGLGRKLGISHNTLLDHLLWIKITPQKYEALKEEGFTDTEIYRCLRNKTDFIKSDHSQSPLSLHKIFIFIRDCKIEDMEMLIKLRNEIDKKINEGGAR